MNYTGGKHTGCLMWPWGHLAAGYLLYTGLTHLRYHRPPQEHPTVALAVGTQLPDLIDKPLAWTLHILPHGRSLGHSLFTAIGLIIAAKLLLGRRSRSKLTSAFGIGYLSHLLVDSLQPLMASEYGALRFLVWPVVPAVEYRTTPSFVGHVLDIELTLYFLLQFGLATFTIALWWYDRKPGLMTALRAPKSAYRKLRPDR